MDQLEQTTPPRSGESRDTIRLLVEILGFLRELTDADRDTAHGLFLRWRTLPAAERRVIVQALGIVEWRPPIFVEAPPHADC